MLIDLANPWGRRFRAGSNRRGHVQRRRARRARAPASVAVASNASSGPAPEASLPGPSPRLQLADASPSALPEQVLPEQLLWAEPLVRTSMSSAAWRAARHSARLPP